MITQKERSDPLSWRYQIYMTSDIIFSLVIFFLYVDIKRPLNRSKVVVK